MTVFTEEWFGEASQKALGDLYRLTEGCEGDVVEVGCWEGCSTLALAEACYPQVVHAVDTWEGSPGEPSAVLAAERDVYETFRANTAGLNIETHRGDWRDYFATHDNPIRFLHIDAAHTYAEVRANIEAALPLMAHGGVICGDDNHHPPVRQAVADTLGAADLTATLWWTRIDRSPLAERYRELCRTPSDIYLHLPRFVELVHRLDASHVIELGTRTGVSTVAWLHALERTGGRLTSIDIDPRPDLGDWDHWSFIQGDDLEPAVVRGLDSADIVFIDTSHRYDHTLAELHVYRHLVRPGGVIVCHDTGLAHPNGAPLRPRYPVRTAIEEFCADEGFEWVNHPECFGLGVIEVS